MGGQKKSMRYNLFFLALFLSSFNVWKGKGTESIQVSEVEDSGGEIMKPDVRGKATCVRAIL